MAYEFKLPDLGEGLTEGEVARWLVEEGQEIAEDDPLVEIQTDKTTVEIPSPAAGKVARILVAEGEVVPVGTVLIVIVQEAPRVAGFAAELAAVVAEKAILDLRGPVLRVTGYDVPYPYWQIEDAYMPSVERVVAAGRRLLDDF
jgi:pyruvate/2-oxoglutarate dehydrogenase complex dihydrolipoamide acyltransferase (E2) component